MALAEANARLSMLLAVAVDCLARHLGGEARAERAAPAASTAAAMKS